MKKAISIALLMLALLTTAGCGFSFNRVVGSGNLITDTRTVNNFDSITLDGLGQVTLTQGDTEGLALTAEDNLVPFIRTNVSNGTLVISFDPRAGIAPTRAITFDIKFKALKSLALSGAGSIRAAGLKSDRLALTINGAGTVQLTDLAANELNVSMNGAGNVSVAGQVTRQSVTVNGLGNYSADDLKSDIASISVAGTGNTTVWVNQTLDVTIAGAGSVSYYGAARVTQRITGLGRVNNIGTK